MRGDLIHHCSSEKALIVPQLSSHGEQLCRFAGLLILYNITHFNPSDPALGELHLHEESSKCTHSLRIAAIDRQLEQPPRLR